MAPHRAHHGADALGDRRMLWVGAALVVLDEVDAGAAQIADQRGGLVRRQADIRLDDGSDQRPFCDAARGAGPGDALTRPLEAIAETLRDRQPLQTQAGALADVEQIAGHGGRQCIQVATDVGNRKRHRDARAPERPVRLVAAQPAARQARCGERLELLDRVDGGPAACAQRIGLAGHPHKGAAALLTRQHFGNRARIERCLDQVAGPQRGGVTIERHRFGAHSLDRSGKGRTGSVPSQPVAASRISRNSRPFGPATSDSSIVVPGSPDESSK